MIQVQAGAKIGMMKCLRRRIFKGLPIEARFIAVCRQFLSSLSGFLYSPLSIFPRVGYRVFLAPYEFHRYGGSHD